MQLVVGGAQGSGGGGGGASSAEQAFSLMFAGQRAGPCTPHHSPVPQGMAAAASVRNSSQPFLSGNPASCAVLVDS